MDDLKLAILGVVEEANKRNVYPDVNYIYGELRRQGSDATLEEVTAAFDDLRVDGRLEQYGYYRVASVVLQ
jgi:hypothetical protein